ncbi:hypothetical protein BamMEX5DRAFT_2839 [Burkholderia ambifaria MEX-5]|uniref:Uncharacterized protein n=1 Tax=Burkholderia ambifaria MEX-5 TaxID=396597 RepID=B1T4X3_9BURK|nr:hypothetical protein BamMEX5DRAFT_2839 [Burkholderia ambifaria MEX-5]
MPPCGRSRRLACGSALNRRFARLMMPACSWVVRRSQAIHAVFCRPGFDVLSNLETMFFSTSADFFATVRYVCRWLALSALLGALAGTASALFLLALDWATGTRVAHPWLLWGLPAAGFATGWVYHRFGQSVARGNNLLIDEIHDPKALVPKRMAPLVLVATVVTHLFGGSAGREGTAGRWAARSPIASRTCSGSIASIGACC